MRWGQIRKASSMGSGQESNGQDSHQEEGTWNLKHRELARVLTSQIGSYILQTESLGKRSTIGIQH